jgi:hypothetical protein
VAHHAHLKTEVTQGGAQVVLDGGPMLNAWRSQVVRWDVALRANGLLCHPFGQPAVPCLTVRATNRTNATGNSGPDFLPGPNPGGGNSPASPGAAGDQDAARRPRPNECAPSALGLRFRCAREAAPSAPCTGSADWLTGVVDNFIFFSGPLHAWPETDASFPCLLNKGD